MKINRGYTPSILLPVQRFSPIEPRLQLIQIRYHDLLRCSFCMHLVRIDLVALQHVLHQSTTSIDHKLTVTHAKVSFDDGCLFGF